jgi:hypothetical protein
MYNSYKQKFLPSICPTQKLGFLSISKISKICLKSNEVINFMTQPVKNHIKSKVKTYSTERDFSQIIDQEINKLDDILQNIRNCFPTIEKIVANGNYHFD